MDLFEMPSFFKNYVTNIDRDRSDRQIAMNNVAGTLDVLNVRSPNGAYKWLNIAVNIDRSESAQM